MRLGQIARKLNEDTETLVSFLKSKDIEIENSPNTKIEDKIADLLNTKFQIDNLTTFTDEQADITSLTPLEEEKEVVEILSERENSTTEQEETSSSQDEEHTKSKEEGQEGSSEKNLSSQIEVDSTNPAIEPVSENDYKVNEIEGVIRVTKQQLEGIRVVGKIELPQQEEKLTKDNVVEKSSTETTENKEANIDIEKSKIHPNKKGRVSAPKRKKNCK
jgi:translation initiation factor IF-2